MISTCRFPVSHFQCEIHYLHLETIFTEECRGLMESFITWYNMVSDQHQYHELVRNYCGMCSVKRIPCMYSHALAGRLIHGDHKATDS